MNATAAPISTANATPAKSPGTNPATPKPTPSGSHFGTDAVYKGYDLMVRRFATHIIREPRVSTASRADLVRAISSPAVTFAASASDGAILICCPDGLPDILIPLAEPLAQDSSATLTHKIDQLDQKLGALMQDQGMIERISDRLEMLEHSLRERPDLAAVTEVAQAEATRALEARLDQLGDRITAVLQAITGIPVLDTAPLEHSLSLAEARLLTAIPPATDLSPVLLALDDMTARIATIPQADATLARVETRLDDLASRPVPTPDMTAHEAAMTQTSAALAGLVTRLDQSIDRLPDPQMLVAQAENLATLLTQVAETPVETTRLLAPHLDFTPFGTQLHDMAALEQSSQAALAALSVQITALADRPLPVLDLGAQNEGLRSIAGTLTDMTQQLTDLTRITTAGPDLVPLVTQYETILTTLGQPAQSAEMTAALTQLAGIAHSTDTILTTLGQPAQSPDMTAALTQLGSIATSTDTLLTTLGQPAQNADMTAALTQLGQLTERPVPILDLTEQNQRLGAISAGLDTLGLVQAALLTTLGQPAQSAEVTAALAELGTDLANLAARPAPVLDFSDLASRIDGLAQTTVTAPQLDDRFDTVKRLMGQPAQDATMAEAFAALMTQILHLIERPQPSLDLTDHMQSLRDLEAPLNAMAQRLDAVAQTLSHGPDRLALQAGFDRLLNALGQPAQEANLARTAAQVSQLAQRLDSLSDSLAEGPDLSPLSGQFAAGLAQLGQPAQHQALLQALSDLTEQVAIVAERPDPVIDMTTQRQSFAQFGTALGLAVQRLETVAAAVNGTAAVDLSPVLAQLAALRADLPTAAPLTQLSEQIAQWVEASALARQPDLSQNILAELATLSDQIAALPREVAQMPDITGPLQRMQDAVLAAMPADNSAALDDSLTILAARMSDLAARPLPAPDLTAQRQDFAQFAGSLAGAVERLEDVALQVAAHDPARIVTQIAALQDDLAAQRREMLQPQDLTDLSQKVTALLDRTDPADDIAGQKLHLAAFAQGLADLIQWLDPLTHDLAAGPDFGPILSEFDLLRGDLNLPARDAALEAAFAHLSDQIADLAKSPDGLVSLAEQRRSFSSFSNALSFMLQRFDALEHGTGTARAPIDLSAAGGEDRLARQIQIMSGSTDDHPMTDLATTLQALVLRLDHLLARIESDTTPHAAQPAATPPVRITDPALLVDNLANATTALAQVVDLLEGEVGTAAGLPPRHPADQTGVAELFDRLDAAMALRDLRTIPATPALAEAVAALSVSVHGQGADLPLRGQEGECLHRLRHDFAELVACALQMQFDTPPAPAPLP